MPRAAVASLLLLTGCAGLSGYPDRVQDPATTLKETAPFTDLAVVNAALSNPSLTQAHRNEIINAKILEIDLKYHLFEEALTSQQNGYSVATDWAALALAGIGATTGSAATKAALAAASAGILGAKASVDKDLFYSKTLPALIAQMDAQRKTVLANIYQGMTKSTADYPLVRALNDLEDYYNAGTINGALEGIATAAGAQNQAATAQIQAVLTGKFSYDDPSKKLRDFWMPGGTRNAANEVKLKLWMKANSISTENISPFIYLDVFKDARVKAVKDLNIQ